MSAADRPARATRRASGDRGRVPHEAGGSDRMTTITNITQAVPTSRTAIAVGSPNGNPGPVPPWLQLPTPPPMNPGVVPPWLQQPELGDPGVPPWAQVPDPAIPPIVILQRQE